MSSKVLILTGLLFALSLGAGTAHANGKDPRLPKGPVVALYCPSRPSGDSPWANLGSPDSGSLLNGPEGGPLGTMPSQKLPHSVAKPEFRFGTVGDLTSLNIRTDSGLTPYLGARFGLSDPANSLMVVPKKVAQEEKTNFLPYRLGFGFGCEMNKNLTLNLGYRVALPTQLLLKDSFRRGLEPPQQGSELSLRIRLNF
jgi:hypothetical protein